MYNQIKTIYNEILNLARARHSVIIYIYLNMDYESGNFYASAMIGGECYRAGFDINNEFYFRIEKGKEKEDVNKCDNKKG